MRRKGTDDDKGVVETYRRSSADEASGEEDSRDESELHFDGFVGF